MALESVDGEPVRGRTLADSGVIERSVARSTVWAQLGASIPETCVVLIELHNATLYTFGWWADAAPVGTRPQQPSEPPIRDATSPLAIALLALLGCSVVVMSVLRSRRRRGGKRLVEHHSDGVTATSEEPAEPEEPSSCAL